MGAVPSRARRVVLGVSAGVLAVLGVLDLVQHYHTDPAAAFALSVVRVLPLLLFRPLPLAAWSLELAAVVGTALATVPVSPAEPWPWAVTSTATLAAMSGLVATRGDRHLPVVMLAVVTGVGLVLTIWPGRGDWLSFVVTTVVCGLAVVVGDVVHSHRRMEVQLAEEKKVSAAERELRSVVEERARIARELHDVVAHHMSTITVQAETARYRLADLPPEATAEFTEIARVARSSLSELRGLLSALRDDAADPDRTPQPTLADLPALVARITAAGTPVTLAVTTDTADLPQVVQLAVYRTVQEALSNVVRHAAGARARVTITRTPTTIAAEITNDRPAAPPRPAGPRAGGHGLRGLEERAALLGGRLDVDPSGDGWRVRVELPL
jgi:signal transduction histidine kinase